MNWLAYLRGVFLLFDRNDEIIYRLPAIDQGNLNIAAYLVADAVICIVSLLFCNVGTIDKGDKGGIPRSLPILYRKLSPATRRRAASSKRAMEPLVSFTSPSF